MKKREFNQLLRQCSSEKKVGKKKVKFLDKEKMTAMLDEDKKRIISYLVRHRHPIVQEFINESTDMRWLYACGYGYWETNTAGYTFLCTSEQQVKLQAEEKQKQNIKSKLDVPIWQGWTTRNFIEELEPLADIIQARKGITEKFETREQVKLWCMDNQPYLKKYIPAVVDYFCEKYNITN